MYKIQDTPMADTEIMHLLQIAGGSFPIGSFTQSYGLETYIAEGKIENTIQLKQFLKTLLKNTISKGEAPILIAAYQYMQDQDWAKIGALNELALAAKLTKESRNAFQKSGKALLRVGRELAEDKAIETFYQNNRNTGISFNVAYAILMKTMGVNVESAAAAYFFSCANTVIQAAIKLLPLGNVQGQKVLAEMIPFLSECAEQALNLEVKDISNFAPMLDMASIDHEELTTRLYMT